MYYNNYAVKCMWAVAPEIELWLWRAPSARSNPPRAHAFAADNNAPNP